jgi:hypothetical protein
LRILPVGLLFAHPFGPYLGSISDPHFHLQFGEEALEPARMPAGFHAHPHLLARQSTVKLLPLCAM